MTALLWTLAIVGALNTTCVLLSAAAGTLGEVKFERVWDWFWTAGLGVWAFWLLAGQR